MKIYIDESGNTGHDYMNAAQPFFVLSANWLCLQDASYFLKILSSNQPAKEIKFSKLQRRAVHHKKIKEACIFLSQNRDKFCSFLLHKHSILVEKFVHDCIEPALYDYGIDLFDGNGHLGYANIVNIMLPAEMGELWYFEFLNLYNDFIRRRSVSELEKLAYHCKTAKKESFQILTPFIRNPLAALKEIDTDHYKSDVYEAAVLGIITNIRNQFNIKDFELHYDPIKSTTDSDLHEVTSILNHIDKNIVVNEVCTIFNDITVNFSKSTNSDTTPQIQVSDFIAGLTNFTFKNENMETDIAQSYLDTIEDRNLIHKICSDAVTHKDLGVQRNSNAINAITRAAMNKSKTKL